MKKIKDLVKTYPLKTEMQNIFDNVAEHVFNTDEITEYMYSDRVESRWPSNENYANAKNEQYPLFDSYGKNEQYILNHITFTKKNILFLIGGIGVGKTSFIKHFIENIQPTKHHECTKKCIYQKDGGFHIYIDFNLIRRCSFQSGDAAAIYSDISKILIIELKNVINKIVPDKKIQIVDLWDKIIEKGNLSVNFKNIENQLQDGRLLLTDLNPENELKLRISILTEISKNVDDELTYLCEILNYLICNAVAGKCFFIIIDNIDIYSLKVQNIAKDIIVTQFAKTKAQVILSVRQSTYCALFEHSFAREAADTVPQLGPQPSEVVKNKLQHFLAQPDKYLKSVDLSAVQKKSFLDNATLIYSFIDKNSEVYTFINSISGNSIRKAIILSRNLITNCVYDLTKDTITVSKIQRALMIGNVSSFSWSNDSLIENLYHVDNYRENCYYTKMRILRMLSIREFPNGLEINKVIELLIAFKYSYDHIRYAINELLQESKRLIWSNTKLNFESSDEMLALKDGKLFISSSGIQHQKWLFKNFTYFQEIALDLYVDSNNFGIGGYDYTDIVNRFKILKKLIKVFFEQDIKEVSNFVDKYSYARYRKYFEGTALISEELMDSIKKSFDDIYRYKQDQRTVNNELKEFYAEFCYDYDSMKTIAHNFKEDLDRTNTKYSETERFKQPLL